LRTPFTTVGEVEDGEGTLIFSCGGIIGLCGFDLGGELAKGDFFSVNSDVCSPDFPITTPINAFETRGRIAS